MRLNAFVDEKVLEKMFKNDSSGDKDNTLFPEHYFLAACIKFGFCIEDLKKMTFISVLKVLYSFNNASTSSEKSKTRNATQRDINKLFL